MKSCLISGGLGFIGSHVYEAMKDDYDITIVDNHSNNKITAKDVNCLVVDSDIRDYYSNQIFDYVIHLAAIASINPEFDPELYSVNIHGFENIHGLYYRNFIYASSAAAINKLNDYGKTKAHNEHIARLDLGFRFFNVYGKRDNGIVGKLLKPNPVIFGGTQTRDFVYVKDVVDTILSNLDKKGIIEVGTGIETSINELASIMNIAAEIKPYKEFEERRSVCLNPIEYKYTLAQGLEDMKL